MILQILKNYQTRIFSFFDLTKMNEYTARQRCCDVKGRKFLYIVGYLCCYIPLTSHGFLTYCSSVNFYHIEKRKNTCLLIFRDLQNHFDGILEAKCSLAHFVSRSRQKNSFALVPLNCRIVQSLIFNKFRFDFSYLNFSCVSIAPRSISKVVLNITIFKLPIAPLCSPETPRRKRA